MEIDQQQRRTESFFKTVEAGDIALFDIISEAIAIFGFTKVGKTSSCHILCDSPLRSDQANGELFYKATTNKYANAKIGLTTESETQIPNIFEANVKEKGKVPVAFKKIKVLDQPGYGDTYGFHRIFSNGYFHYRTFSKTPQLKFVLAISKLDLTGTAQKFKKTILNFANTFKNWEDIKENILKATSFLITKADPRTKLQNLKGTISALRNSDAGMGIKQREKYHFVIDQILAAERIFFIEKPSKKGQLPSQNNILQKIYDSSAFWKRQILGNIADMSEINFEVSNQILRELRDKDKEVFRQDFFSFMNFIENRRERIFVSHPSSLVNIVKTLQKDAVENSESRVFLSDMESFVSEFYSFSPQYKEKRELTEVELFKSAETDRLLEQVEIEKEMRSVYFIKKFKVLQFLCSQSTALEDLMFEMSRSIEQLQNISTIFLAIFKMFSILRVRTSDKIIFKYSYVIQRAIEQSKILTLILFTSQAKEEIQKFDMEKTWSEDIYRKLIDRFFTGVLGEIQINTLKEEFISNLDFDNLKSINKQTILFFESIDNKTQNIQFKLAEMIVEYSNLLLKKLNPDPEEKKFAICQLFKYRNNFYAFLKNLQNQENSKDTKEKVTELVIVLTNSLANLLQNHQMYEDARQCYRSVSNAESVFQMYELECKSEMNNPDIHRKLLLKYASEASKYHRKELAMKCCQQAYALCTKYADMMQVKNQIVELYTGRDEDETKEESQILQQQDELTYLQCFFRNKLCSDFSQSLRTNIELGFDIES